MLSARDSRGSELGPGRRRGGVGRGVQRRGRSVLCLVRRARAGFLHAINYALRTAAPRGRRGSFRGSHGCLFAPRALALAASHLRVEIDVVLQRTHLRPVFGHSGLAGPQLAA